MELFIENKEKYIFDTAAVRNVRPNILKEEKEALKEIRSWNNQTVRVQDKGSRFVILDNNDYEQKIQTQIDRSSFNRLEEDPSKKFDIEINNWVLKWHRKKVLDDKWKSYITPHNSRPGKMYGNIKTHKADNPARVITSGCNTAVEHLSIFVEKVLYGIASELPSGIKDTNHMSDIIDDLNNLNLYPESVLVSFDIINMFPVIDNKMGINSAIKLLDERACKSPPTQCVIEAHELCSNFNNSIFNNTNYIQTDGTAQGPHMSCSYSDIAMAGHDSKALMYDFPPKVWKRFRDDVFVVWTHDTAKLPSFLDYLNNIDETGKIKFTMQIADEVNGLEFLDLKIKCLNGKLSVDVYSKPTNIFAYVLPPTCYPMENINNVP